MQKKINLFALLATMNMNLNKMTFQASSTCYLHFGGIGLVRIVIYLYLKSGFSTEQWYLRSSLEGKLQYQKEIDKINLFCITQASFDWMIDRPCPCRYNLEKWNVCDGKKVRKYTFQYSYPTTNGSSTNQTCLLSKYFHAFFPDWWDICVASGRNIYTVPQVSHFCLCTRSERRAMRRAMRIDSSTHFQFS